MVKLSKYLAESIELDEIIEEDFNLKHKPIEAQADRIIAVKSALFGIEPIISRYSGLFQDLYKQINADVFSTM